MSKRKDCKGRNLRTGEGQRANGLYYYQATDKYGNRTTLTSWRLVPTDPLPKGKRDCIPLREQEEELTKQIKSKLDLSVRCTVMEAALKYKESRIGLKPQSMIGINTFNKVLGKYKLSHMQINDVEVKDVKWFCRALYKDNYSVTTIMNYKGRLSSVFAFASEELHLLTKNPTEFKLNSVIKETPNKRGSLSKQDKEEFIRFIKSDNVSRKHFDEINLLLGTGLRISEFVGLTEDNVDFENHCIVIDHQLQNLTPNREWLTPKSEAGNRMVFISDDVEASARRLIEAAYPKRSGFTCGNTSKFIILDRNGNPRKDIGVRDMLRSIVNRYHRKTGKELPHIIPHMLRHTYCTDQAQAGMDMMALQYMMGHTDMSTTSRYLHTQQNHAAAEAARLYRKQASVGSKDAV